ncbi:MAG: HAD hydrolase-like protein [Planctomycetes bacterium]|nr:HAD hydrolase-like protein [Planctomycetota bacterium]
MKHHLPLVLVDADDTLWENYRHFVRVLDAWAQFMESCGVDTVRATAALESCEDRNIPRTGYGAAPFVASLREAYAELRPGAPRGEAGAFGDLALWAEDAIRSHPIELLPGVAEALTAMAPRARLVVFTKGDEAEQTAKVERSGLASLFHGVRVVPEKHSGAYAQECERRQTEPRMAWMVGNSARSDVNPARRAGMLTVHVPHPAPWHRDEEPLEPVGPPTLVARTFADVPHLVLGHRGAAGR